MGVVRGWGLGVVVVRVCVCVKGESEIIGGVAKKYFIDLCRGIWMCWIYVFMCWRLLDTHFKIRIQFKSLMDGPRNGSLFISNLNFQSEFVLYFFYVRNIFISNMLKNSQVSKKHCGQKRIKWSALKKHLKHLKDMNTKKWFSGDKFV